MPLIECSAAASSWLMSAPNPVIGYTGCCGVQRGRQQPMIANISCD